MRKILQSVLVLFTILCVFSTELMSQVTLLKDEFIDVRDVQTTHHVVPFQNDYLLLIYKEYNTYNLVVQSFSKDWVAQGQKILEVPKGFYLSNERHSENFANFLIVNNSDDFIVHHLDPSTMGLKTYKGSVNKGSRYIQLFATDSKLFVYSDHKEEPELFIFDLSNDNSKTIPLIIPELESDVVNLFDLVYLPESNDLFLLLNVKSKSQMLSYVMHVKLDGEFVNAFNLSSAVESENPMILSTLQVRSNGSDEFVFVGAYTNEKALGLSPVGIYFSFVTDSKLESVSYYGIDEIEGFKTLVRSGKSNYEKLMFRFSVNLHKIEKVDNVYIIVGEVINIKYSDILLNAPQGEMIGYETSGAFALGIDSDGNLLWSKLIELKPYYYYQYSQLFINMINEGNGLVLRYPSENMLHAVLLTGDGDVIEQKKESSVLGSNLMIEREFENRVIPGYNDTYISFGYRNIHEVSDKIIDDKKSAFNIQILSWE